MNCTKEQSGTAALSAPISFMRSSAPSTESHFDWLRCSERLSEANCEEIIAACLTFQLTAPDTVGEERYPGRRRASARKIGVNKNTQWIFALLCDVAAQASAVAYALELTEVNRSPQYVEYRPEWGQFDWHNDYSHELVEAPRKLTLIIQLSDPADYDGGRLQVFGTEIEDLPNERGTIIAFPSLLYHRVTPVTRGLRRALVAWVAGPRIR